MIITPFLHQNDYYCHSLLNKLDHYQFIIIVVDLCDKNGKGLDVKIRSQELQTIPSDLSLCLSRS